MYDVDCGLETAGRKEIHWRIYAISEEKHCLKKKRQRFDRLSEANLLTNRTRTRNVFMGFSVSRIKLNCFP